MYSGSKRRREKIQSYWKKGGKERGREKGSERKRVKSGYMDTQKERVKREKRRSNRYSKGE